MWRESAVHIKLTALVCWCQPNFWAFCRCQLYKRVNSRILPTLHCTTMVGTNPHCPHMFRQACRPVVRPVKWHLLWWHQNPLKIFFKEDINHVTEFWRNKVLLIDLKTQCNSSSEWYSKISYFHLFFTLPAQIYEPGVRCHRLFFAFKPCCKQKDK